MARKVKLICGLFPSPMNLLLRVERVVGFIRVAGVLKVFEHYVNERCLISRKKSPPANCKFLAAKRTILEVVVVW